MGRDRAFQSFIHPATQQPLLDYISIFSSLRAITEGNAEDLITQIKEKKGIKKVYTNDYPILLIERRFDEKL